MKQHLLSISGLFAAYQDLREGPKFPGSYNLGGSKTERHTCNSYGQLCYTLLSFNEDVGIEFHRKIGETVRYFFHGYPRAEKNLKEQGTLQTH